MAGRIPNTFIDDLIDRADIVDVIDSRVKLKRTGKNYSACCPFHQEKTPSFTVSPDKQFFYCFGCGASGNALGFVMDFERLDFVGAIESLAKDMGLDVPREKSTFKPGGRPAGSFGPSAKVRNPLYTHLETAEKFFKIQLRKHSDSPKAIDYLKNRGLTGDIAKTFGIGFAPPGWANLLNQINPEGDDKITKQLIDCGMVVENHDSGKTYDRFRDRIMFPIRDTKGRVIGFGGRVLGDEKPKYLNSPETPVFSKGKELYGLYEARKATRKLERLVVVEGYMDVVALAQKGITWAVATLGTATTADHLERMFKYVNQVVFCFDGDQAGRTAAVRALDNALPVLKDGCEIRFLFLPDGEDPDTLVRSQGADAFIREVEDAMPLSHFLLETAGAQLDLGSVDGRARLATEAAPRVAKLKDGVFKSLMMGDLSERTGLDRASIESLVEQAVSKELEREQRREARYEPTSSPTATARASTPTDTTEANDYNGYEHAIPNYNDAPVNYDASYYDSAPIDDLDYAERTQPLTQNPHSGKKIHLDQIENAIALVLHNPNLAEKVEVSALKTVKEAKVMLLVQLIELLTKKPFFSLQQILGHWRATFGVEESDKLARYAMNEPVIPKASFASELKNIITQAVTEQTRHSAAEEIAQLSSKPFATLSTEEKERLLKLLADAPKYRTK